MKNDNVMGRSESLLESLVYVVDDDESIRGALTSLLKSVGIRVHSHSNRRTIFSPQKCPTCRVVSYLTYGCEAQVA